MRAASWKKLAEKLEFQRFKMMEVKFYVSCGKPQMKTEA
jgi:hypothetical protein